MIRDAHNRFRHVLHNHYLSFPEAEAIRHVHDDVEADDWEKLCAHFSSPEYKMRSEKCALSRSNLRVHHVAGTKSFVQLLDERRDPETGEEPGRVDFYEITYRRHKTGEWSSQRAEELHTEMKSLLDETSIEGETSGRQLTQDEVADKVLGKRPDYVRGLGFGVCPTSSSRSRTSSSQAAEVDELRRESIEMRKESAELRAIINTLLEKQQESDARLQQQEALIQALIARFPPPPTTAATSSQLDEHSSQNQRTR